MKKYLFVILFFCSCRSQSTLETNNGKFDSIEVYLKTENINAAESLFTTINYSDKIDFNYNLTKVLLQFKKKKFDNTIILCKQFINSYPSSAFGYYYMGLSLFNLADYQNAQNSFDSAYKTYADYSNLYKSTSKNSDDVRNFDASALTLSGILSHPHASASTSSLACILR